MLDCYLLLDAGGTIIFPDFRLMHGLCLQQGQEISEATFRRTASEFIFEMEDELRRGLERSHWPRFVPSVLERAGVRAQIREPVQRALSEWDHDQGLWTYTYSWVRQALVQLANLGLRMSVISNADGRAEEHLVTVGLAQHFERVFDSSLVGFEKPDPRLFAHALETLGLAPEECLYVGDVYHVDVAGANGAGIACVHLDPFGLYDSWPGVHIGSIADLAPLLVRPGLSLDDDALFPLRAVS